MKFLKTSMVVLLSTCLVLNSIPVYGMYDSASDEYLDGMFQSFNLSVPVGITMQVRRSALNGASKLQAGAADPSSRFEIAAYTLNFAQDVVARPLERDATLEQQRLQTALDAETAEKRAAAARLLALENEVTRLTGALKASEDKLRDLNTNVIPQLRTDIVRLGNEKQQETDKLPPIIQLLDAATKEKTRLEQIIPQLTAERDDAVTAEKQARLKIGVLKRKNKQLEENARLIVDQTADLDAITKERDDLAVGKSRLETDNTALSAAKQAAEAENTRLQNLEQDLRDQLQEITKKHGDLITERAELRKQHDDEVAKLEADHAVQVAQIAAEKADALRDLQEKHTAEVARLNNTHQEELRKLREAYAQQIRALGDDQAVERTRLETQFKTQTQQLQHQQTQAVADLNATHADALTQKDDVHTQAVHRLQDDHARIMREKEDEYQQQIVAIREELRVVKNTEVQLKLDIAQLEKEKSDLSREMQRLQDEHAQTLFRVAADHKAQLEALEQVTREQVAVVQKELADARAAFEGENKVLADQLSSLQAQHDIKLAEIDSINAQLKKLQQDIGTKTSELETQKASLKTEKSQKEEALAQLEKKKAEFELLKKFAEENIGELRKAKDETNKKVVTLGRIFSSSKEDLESRMKALSDQYSQKALAEQIKHERALDEAHQGYEQRVRDLEDQQKLEIKKLEDAAAASLREFGKLLTQGEHRLRDIEDQRGQQIQVLEARLQQDAQAHARELAAKQAAYDAQSTEALQGYMDGLEKVRQAAHEASEKHTQELASYTRMDYHQAQMAEMRMQLERDKAEALGALATTKDVQIHRVQEQLTQRETENTHLARAVADLKTQNGGLTDNNGQLRARLATEEEEKRKALDQVAALSAELEKARQALTATQTELGLVKEENKRLSADNQRMVDEIADLKNRLETALKETADLVDQMKALKLAHEKSLAEEQEKYARKEQSLIDAQTAYIAELTSQHQQQMLEQKTAFEEQMRGKQDTLQRLQGDLSQQKQTFVETESVFRQQYNTLESTAEKEKVELRSQMAALQEKFDTENQSVQKTMASVKADMSQLKIEYAQKEELLKSQSEAEIKKIQAENAKRLEAQQLAHQLEITRIQEQHERAMSALRSELQAAEQKFAEEKSVLEQKNADLMSETAKLGDQETVLRESIDALKAEYSQDKLRLEQEYKSAMEDALLKQREKFRKEVDQKFAQLEEHHAQMDQRSNDALGALEARIDSLTRQLTTERKTTDALREAQTALHSLRAQTKAEEARRSQQLQERSAELEAAQVKLRKMEREVRDVRETKQKLLELQQKDKELRAMLAQYMGLEESANLKALQAKFRQDQLAGRLKEVALESDRHKGTIETLLRDYGKSIGMVTEQMKALGQKVDKAQSLVPATKREGIQKLPGTLAEFMEFCGTTKANFESLFRAFTSLYEEQRGYARTTSSSRSATPSSARGGPTPPLSARSDASASRRGDTPFEDAQSMSSVGGFSDTGQDAAHQEELVTLRALHDQEMEALRIEHEQEQGKLYRDYQIQLQRLQGDLAFAESERGRLEEEVAELRYKFSELEQQHNALLEENEDFRGVAQFTGRSPVFARGYRGSMPKVGPNIDELKRTLENLRYTERMLEDQLESTPGTAPIGAFLAGFQQSFNEIASSSLTDILFKTRVEVCLDALKGSLTGLYLGLYGAGQFQRMLGAVQERKKLVQEQIDQLLEQEQQQQGSPVSARHRSSNTGGGVTMERIEESKKIVGGSHPALVDYTDALEHAVVGMFKFITEVNALLGRTQARLGEINLVKELTTPRFSSSTLSMRTPTSVRKRVAKAQSLQDELMQAMNGIESEPIIEGNEEEEDGKTLAYNIVSHYDVLAQQLDGRGVTDLLSALRIRIAGTNTAQAMQYQLAIDSLEGKIKQLTADGRTVLEALHSKNPLENSIVAALVVEKAQSIATALVGEIERERDEAYRKTLEEKPEGAPSAAATLDHRVDSAEMLLALNINTAWVEHMNRYAANMRRLQERMGLSLQEWLQENQADSSDPMTLTKKWIKCALGIAMDADLGEGLENFLLGVQKRQFGMILEDLEALVTNIQTVHNRYKEPVDDRSPLASAQESTPLTKKGANAVMSPYVNEYHYPVLAQDFRERLLKEAEDLSDLFNENVRQRQGEIENILELEASNVSFYQNVRTVLPYLTIYQRETLGMARRCKPTIVVPVPSPAPFMGLTLTRPTPPVNSGMPREVTDLLGGPDSTNLLSALSAAQATPGGESSSSSSNPNLQQYPAEVRAAIDAAKPLSAEELAAIENVQAVLTPTAHEEDEGEDPEYILDEEGGDDESEDEGEETRGDMSRRPSAPQIPLLNLSGTSAAAGRLGPRRSLMGDLESPRDPAASMSHSTGMDSSFGMAASVIVMPAEVQIPKPVDRSSPPTQENASTPRKIDNSHHRRRGSLNIPSELMVLGGDISGSNENGGGLPTSTHSSPGKPSPGGIPSYLKSTTSSAGKRVTNHSSDRGNSSGPNSSSNSGGSSARRVLTSINSPRQ